MNEHCALCGHRLARFRGYLLRKTPWGVEYRHKPGECLTGWVQPQTLAQKISDIH